MTEPTSDGLPFEEALVELERTVRDLEDGRLGLDEALARYEDGVGLIKSCHARLRLAEQRILLLTGVDDAGRAGAATVPARSDRRRQGGPGSPGAQEAGRDGVRQPAGMVHGSLERLLEAAVDPSHEDRRPTVAIGSTPTAGRPGGPTGTGSTTTSVRLSALPPNRSAPPRPAPS